MRSRDRDAGGSVVPSGQRAVFARCPGSERRTLSPRRTTRERIVAFGRPAPIISCDDECGSASGASSDRPCGDPFLDDDWPCDLSRAIRWANHANDESSKASSGIVSERNRSGGQTQGEGADDVKSRADPTGRDAGPVSLVHAIRRPRGSPKPGSTTASPTCHFPGPERPDRAAEPGPGRGVKASSCPPRPGRSPCP
jgi:hypothetical protein